MTTKMRIELTKEAENQYKKLIRSGQKKLLKKVVKIFDEL